MSVFSYNKLTGELSTILHGTMSLGSFEYYTLALVVYVRNTVRVLTNVGGSAPPQPIIITPCKSSRDTRFFLFHSLR